MPAARAPAQSWRGLSPQCSAAAGGTPSRARAPRKMDGSGFAAPADGARRHRAEAVRHAEARQDPRQAAVPVADDRQPRAAGVERVEGRQGVGHELEAQAGDEHLRQPRPWEGRRRRARPRSRAAQSRRRRRERRRVAPAVVVARGSSAPRRPPPRTPAPRGGGGPRRRAARAGAGPAAGAAAGCRRRRGARRVPECRGPRGGRRPCAIIPLAVRPWGESCAESARASSSWRSSWSSPWRRGCPCPSPSATRTGPGERRSVLRGWIADGSSSIRPYGCRAGRGWATMSWRCGRPAQVWAGPPALAQSVDLVYMDGPFEVPVPPGGLEPPAGGRVAVPALAPGVGRGGNDVRRTNSARGAPDDRPPRLPLRPRGLGHPEGRGRERPPPPPAAQGAPGQAAPHTPRPDRRRAPSPRSSWAAVLVSALAVNSVGESLRDGELKEIRLGQNSRIYDKNGKQLGIIAGVTNRTVVPGGADPQGPEGRDGRDRGQALLRARRRRLLPPGRRRGARPRERLGHPGRQHDHDAARQEPLRARAPTARSARSSRRRTSPSSTRSGTRRTRSWRGT